MDWPVEEGTSHNHFIIDKVILLPMSTTYEVLTGYATPHGTKMAQGYGNSKQKIKYGHPIAV